MENVVFKKSYPAPETESLDEKRNDEFHSKLSELAKQMDKFSQTLPKIAAPKWQYDYNEILKECDKLVQRYGGEIQGEINYENWNASIEITIPEFALIHPNDFKLLQHISESATYMGIFPTDDSQLKIQITLRYFTYIADENAEAQLTKIASNFNQIVAETFGSELLYPAMEDVDDESLGVVLDIIQRHWAMCRQDAFMELVDLSSAVADAYAIGEVVFVNKTLVFHNDSDEDTPPQVTSGLSELTEIFRFIIDDLDMNEQDSFMFLMSLLESINKVDQEKFLDVEDTGSSDGSQ